MFFSLIPTVLLVQDYLNITEFNRAMPETVPHFLFPKRGFDQKNRSEVKLIENV